MNDSRYRWVIVAAGGLLGCVAIGSMFSLPVLLQPIVRNTGWSVAGVSSAMTVGFIALAGASMVWGTLSDRYGPLPVVLTGATVLAASLALASRATSLIEFQLVFGLLVGGATAAIFAPMMACVTGWFDTHRRPPALVGDNAAASARGGSQSEMSLGQAVRSPQFVILLLTNFFCCATHSGPIIHTVSYAVSCGIPLIAAVSIYSVEGLAGLFGR